VNHFPDSVTLAADPATIMERLLLEADDFEHIREAAPRFLVLFSQRVLFLHGGQKAAVIIQPRWQGPLGMVAEFLVAQLGRPVLDGQDPDYIIIIDIACWSALDPEGSERLIFHELKHLAWMEDEFGVGKRNQQTGKPMLKLVPHDIELFDAEMRRYGVEVCGAEDFLMAVVDGEANKRRRNLRIA
jgi:Putative phage metallopeptidase